MNTITLTWSDGSQTIIPQSVLDRYVALYGELPKTCTITES